MIRSYSVCGEKNASISRDLFKGKMTHLIDPNNIHRIIYVSSFDRQNFLARANLVSEYLDSPYSMREFLYLYQNNLILWDVYRVLGPISIKIFQNWYKYYHQRNLITGKTHSRKGIQKFSSPMQKIQIDYILHNAFIHENGESFQPSITICFDCATGKILSFFVSKKFGAQSVLSTLSIAFKKYGTPAMVNISWQKQQGESLLSNEEKIWLSGLFFSMGIVIHYNKKQSKGHSDFLSFFVKKLHKNFSYSCMEMSVFINKFSSWIKDYENGVFSEKITGSIGCQFNEYFNKKHFDERIFSLIFSESIITTVHPDGVTFNGANYYAPLLMSYCKKRVKMIPVLDIKITKILICNLKGQYLCQAQIYGMKIKENRLHNYSSKFFVFYKNNIRKASR
ncbi:MAG: Mu transposase C-terminal domain-containing protein [Spirochaetia bacterium]